VLFDDENRIIWGYSGNSIDVSTGSHTLRSCTCDYCATVHIGFDHRQYGAH
jgi:hypothetical protein